MFFFIPLYFRAIQTKDFYVKKAFKILKPHLHALIDIQGFSISKPNMNPKKSWKKHCAVII